MCDFSTYEDLLEYAKKCIDEDYQHARANGGDYDHYEAVLSAISTLEFALDISARFIWANDWHNDLRFIELQEVPCEPTTTLHQLILRAVTDKLELDLFEYDPRENDDDEADTE